MFGKEFRQVLDISIKVNALDLMILQKEAEVLRLKEKRKALVNRAEAVSNDIDRKAEKASYKAREMK